MDRAKFLTLMDSMHIEECSEHSRKSKDYADSEGRNILANFQRVASIEQDEGNVAMAEDRIRMECSQMNMFHQRTAK